MFCAHINWSVFSTRESNLTPDKIVVVSKCFALTLMCLWYSHSIYYSILSLTLFKCAVSNWSAVVPKIHCLGPYTYGVLSVWFKRGQLSSGSVPNNIMKTFTFTMWSVADLIASDDTILVMWWLP